MRLNFIDSTLGELTCCSNKRTKLQTLVVKKKRIKPDQCHNNNSNHLKICIKYIKILEILWYILLCLGAYRTNTDNSLINTHKYHSLLSHLPMSTKYCAHAVSPGSTLSSPQEMIFVIALFVFVSALKCW